MLTLFTRITTLAYKKSEKVWSWAKPPRNASVNGLHCFQVYVTGADGEQMVLSGPEAAALLAQAGISLGEQEQV